MATLGGDSSWIRLMTPAFIGSVKLMPNGSFGLPDGRAFFHDATLNNVRMGEVIVNRGGREKEELHFQTSAALFRFKYDDGSWWQQDKQGVPEYSLEKSSPAPPPSLSPEPPPPQYHGNAGRKSPTRMPPGAENAQLRWPNLPILEDVALKWSKCSATRTTASPFRVPEASMQDALHMFVNEIRANQIPGNLYYSDLDPATDSSATIDLLETETGDTCKRTRASFTRRGGHIYYSLTVGYVVWTEWDLNTRFRRFTKHFRAVLMWAAFCGIYSLATIFRPGAYPMKAIMLATAVLWFYRIAQMSIPVDYPNVNWPHQLRKKLIWERMQYPLLSLLPVCYALLMTDNLKDEVLFSSKVQLSFYGMLFVPPVLIFLGRCLLRTFAAIDVPNWYSPNGESFNAHWHVVSTVFGSQVGD